MRIGILSSKVGRQLPLVGSERAPDDHVLRSSHSGMVWALDELDGYWTREELIASGIRPRQITNAIREGSLLRLRRDHYAPPPIDDVGRAIRLGGRLGCVSRLALLGVFVLDDARLHVHLDRAMSRIRSTTDRRRRLGPDDRPGLALHWQPLNEPGGSRGRVAVGDAVAQAVRCQPARAAIATLDSVLHLGLMTIEDLRDVFATLPPRYATLLRLTDGTAESGTETLTRLILRSLGLRFRAQVQIVGVGRVDFLVEGWLIIECDSRAFHEGWDKQRSDRRRDADAAARGFTTLRFLAEDLLWDPAFVTDAVRGLTRTHR